jgi:hypothetical protein
VILLLTSCATNGQEIEPIKEIIKEKKIYIDTSCKWVQPIYISKADVLTDGTARQILAHNKAFVATCGDPDKLK